MKSGAVVKVQHELFVDLSLSMAEIRSSIRKSYKPLISLGKRYWSVLVLDHEDISIWTEFRELHRVVLGRVTRSEVTWELQHQMIKEGGAFLVYLRNAEGLMIGGGLFNISLCEGSYAVGAYNRKYFDKPLGHVVQYRAVDLSPTDKEFSIAEFKQGFATHLFPQFLLNRKSTL